MGRGLPSYQCKPPLLQASARLSLEPVATHRTLSLGCTETMRVWVPLFICRAQWQPHFLRRGISEMKPFKPGEAGLSSETSQCLYRKQQHSSHFDLYRPSHPPPFPSSSLPAYAGTTPLTHPTSLLHSHECCSRVCSREPS